MPTTAQEHQRAMPMPLPEPKLQKTRKRSPKACLSCRARKVRCDVAFVPNSCTNCVLDSKQCVVSRRRDYRFRNHAENSAHTKTVAVTKSQPAARDDEDSATTPTEEYYGTPKLAETRPRQLSNLDHNARSDITYAYYPFLCISNLSSLHPDDINYLESQGCFRVPESSCLDELLKGFFRYAHPILPVINEAEFWSAYDSTISVGKTNRVPVVLISAMLFVACNYVDDHVIQNMNFTTAREAGERFRRKTQLLYDNETENSPLILAQVSLLLAYWAPQRVRRQGTQWLARAIHHAQDALSEAWLWTFPNKRFTQSNLRRVWGCCILSDRIHSLYSRRPLMIPSGVADTESNPTVLSRADLSYEIGRSRVYGVEAKQKFIEAQEQMSDLCTILGRVLALVYPQNGNTTCRKVPALRGDEDEFRDCKKELKTWYIRVSSLFPVSRRDSVPGSRFSPDIGREDGVSHDESVELILGMMFLHYDSAMLALCHSEMIRLATNPPPVSSTYRQERSFLHDQKEDLSSCVLELTNRLSDCLQHQHLPKFPNSMIFCTALPLLLHLLNTHAHQHEGSASPRAASASFELRPVRVQRSQYPDWIRKVIDCLRPRFRLELEYMLRTVKAVNASVSQEFQDIQEEPCPTSRQEYVLRPGEGSLRTSNWRELLNTRPKLYARLIDTLDRVISWGGPLSETDTPLLLPRRHETPGSGLHQQFRADKAAPLLSPLLSSPSSQRDTVPPTSPSLTYGDEPVSHVESCRANAAFLHLVDLDGTFDSILSQQMDSPMSHLTEAIGEVSSLTPSDPSSEIWREEILDNGGTVLDEIYVCDDAKGVTNGLENAHEFMLGEDQNDEWMGFVSAEDMSLSGDDISKDPVYACTDACMTV